MEIPVDYQPVPETLEDKPNSENCICHMKNITLHDANIFNRHAYLLPIIITTTLVLIIIFAPVDFIKLEKDKTHLCQIQLVETLPNNLIYKNKSTTFLNTNDAWTWLLSNARTSIDISTLSFNMYGAAPTEKILDRLLKNGIAERKLRIRIAHNANDNQIEPNMLRKVNAAQIVSLNLTQHLGGAGAMLHTKLWIVDKLHFYLGSADLTWYSLMHSKELGVLAKNCPDLAKDVQKIFKAYWYLGSNKNIPDNWPNQYEPEFNLLNPILMNFNQKYTMKSYFSSSPPHLSAYGRTYDLDAILSTINSAVSYINIAVMDYYPLIIYTTKLKYWPYIDNALRSAAVERKISVKLLISWWPHSDSSEDYFLHSLQDMSKVIKGVDFQVRRFIMPAEVNKINISYTAINRNKYMVTDSVAYIGTSNWSGDYFTDTAGIGFVLKQTKPSKNLRTELLSVFERDWNCPYAVTLK